MWGVEGVGTLTPVTPFPSRATDYIGYCTYTYGRTYNIVTILGCRAEPIPIHLDCSASQRIAAYWTVTQAPPLRQVAASSTVELAAATDHLEPLFDLSLSHSHHRRLNSVRAASDTASPHFRPIDIDTPSSTPTGNGCGTVVVVESDWRDREETAPSDPKAGED